VLFRSLLPEYLHVRKPLPDWSEPIAAVLRSVYAAVSLETDDEPTSRLGNALGMIGNALRDQSMLPVGLALTPSMTFGDAIRFTLSRLSDQVIARESMADAIELLGWLELQLDDAPVLIVTGFNERNIPQSSHGDGLLPDGIASDLGLMDNDRRYARDAAALTAILHSRDSVTLIAARQGAEGDPLMPSRLWLRCNREHLPARVTRFYPKERPLRITPIAWPCAPANQLLIPAPLPPATPMTRLPVTAFRTYLDCPYRFYLKYILKMQTVSDAVVELDARQFGILIHDVLGAFGKSGLTQSTDADAVFRLLESNLAELSVARFGEDPPAAVLIQVEQIRQRLLAFARWQVEEVAKGWRKHSE